MSSKRRTYRVGEKLQTILARELQRVGDNRFELVTISSVMMSPDLKVANIYWVASGGAARREEVQEAFDGAAGRFRRAAAADLGVRFVPELRFFYDDTLDTAEQIERLLVRVRESDRKAGA